MALNVGRSIYIMKGYIVNVHEANPQFIMSKTKQQNNDIIVILHLAVNMRPLTMRKSSYFIFSKNEKFNYLQTVKMYSSTQIKSKQNKKEICKLK